MLGVHGDLRGNRWAKEEPVQGEETSSDKANVCRRACLFFLMDI